MIPAELVIEILRLPYGNASLIKLMDDGRILFFTDKLSNQPTKTVQPNGQMWQDFRNSLDLINIWNWKREYINDYILDGCWWEINIKYVDKEIHSRGRNKYPPVGYSKLMAAIEKLWSSL